MLHIIGVILKILGIILAVLLGIIVLLVCIVLFVPVRYEVRAEFPGTLEETMANIRFSWLLHLITGEAGYNEKAFYWKIRALWFKLSNEEKSAEHVVAEKKDEIKQTVDVDTISEKPKKEAEKIPVRENKIKEEKEPVKMRSIPKKEKVSFFQKIKNRIKAVWEKITYIFYEICDKIKHITDIKEQAADFLTEETHTKAFQKVKKESKRLIWCLRPKNVKMNLHYGFDDPYRTGQMLAVLSMIYPFVGDNMNVQPDFEHQIFEGNLYIKGKLRAYHLIFFGIRLVLDDNVRRTFIDGKNFKFK